MANSVQTRLVYDVSATSDGLVNTYVLRQEVEDAVAAVAVEIAGSQVVLAFEALLTAVAVSDVDAVVAAHEGSPFVDLPVRVVDVSEVVEASGVEVSVGELQAEPVPAGVYLVSWYCELAINGGAEAAVGKLYYSRNGNPLNQVAAASKTGAEYDSFSGSAPVDMLAGDSVALSLRLQRSGAAGEARVRRRRLFLTRVE